MCCPYNLSQDYGNNAIVLAGCGTSGRLAFMTAVCDDLYIFHHLAEIDMPLFL